MLLVILSNFIDCSFQVQEFESINGKYSLNIPDIESITTLKQGLAGKGGSKAGSAAGSPAPSKPQSAAPSPAPDRTTDSPAPAKSPAPGAAASSKEESTSK